MMKGFVGDIVDMTHENEDFRHVVYTGRNLQLVLMTLKAGEEIGLEVHATHDQFFRVEKGKGEVWIDGVCTNVKRDDAIVVPAGARHNIGNRGEKPLRLYTVYGPPQHLAGTVQVTRAEALASTEHFDGKTSELADRV